MEKRKVGICLNIFVMVELISITKQKHIVKNEANKCQLYSELRMQLFIGVLRKKISETF